MKLPEILDQFRSLRVLVVGDICLDRWCRYNPALAEPSRETSIPRIGVVRTECTPGAGGTVANNLVALGVGRVDVLGVVGVDGFAWELTEALRERGIGHELLIRSPRFSTFTYTKIINDETGVEDRPRVDFVNTSPLPAEAEHDLLKALNGAFHDAGVVIVSDQAETGAGGVITADVRTRICQLAAEHPEKIVWVDSRERPELFTDVVLKPNCAEAEAASRRKLGTVDFSRLQHACRLRTLFVTQGAEGVDIVHNDGRTERIPARKVEAVDICGAGDSFTAGAACTLFLTCSPAHAARVGNLVASITVTKPGTGTASPAELLAAAAAESAR